MSKKIEQRNPSQGPSVPPQNDSIEFTPISENEKEHKAGKAAKHLHTNLKTGHKKIKSLLGTKQGVVGVCATIIIVFAFGVPYSIGLLSTTPTKTVTEHNEGKFVDKSDVPELNNLPIETNVQKPLADDHASLDPLFSNLHGTDERKTDHSLEAVDEGVVETAETELIPTFEDTLPPPVEKNEPSPKVTQNNSTALPKSVTPAQPLPNPLPNHTEPAHSDLLDMETAETKVDAADSLLANIDGNSNTTSTDAASVAPVVASIDMSDIASATTPIEKKTITLNPVDLMSPSNKTAKHQIRSSDHHLPKMKHPVDESDESDEIDETVAKYEEMNVLPDSTVVPAASFVASEISPKYTATKHTEYQARHVKVRQCSSNLPNTHGQIMCEYDITPYTKARGVSQNVQPEQVIVDWIIDQTGVKAWHGETLGILNATPDTLYVYHTPKMQEEVAKIVDRFVNPDVNSDAYSFRVVSLNNPGWLAQGHGFLTPITIHTAGVQGWLIDKEHFTRLMNDISRKPDYKELGSQQTMVGNGREHVVNASIPRNYTRNVISNAKVWPGYTTDMSVMYEGYKINLTPLSGIDDETAELLIKCDISQIEKMVPVILNVSGLTGTKQRVTVESPQVAQFHLDEKIEWPKGKVLILDLGSVPVPGAAKYNDNGKLIPELSRKLSGNPTVRGNVLLFVECKSQ